MRNAFLFITWRLGAKFGYLMKISIKFKYTIIWHDYPLVLIVQ